MLLAWLRSLSIGLRFNLVVGLSIGSGPKDLVIARLTVPSHLKLKSVAISYGLRYLTVSLFLLGYHYDHLLFALPFARH